MLKTSISKTINGTSIVKQGELDVVAAAMSASITEDGSVNINKNVVNKDAYNANKADVRTDMEEFEKFVYSQEDSNA